MKRQIIKLPHTIQLTLNLTDATNSKLNFSSFSFYNVKPLSIAIEYAYQLLYIVYAQRIRRTYISDGSNTSTIL